MVASLAGGAAVSRVNPEVRAAEIVAAIETDYKRGGWFECMTLGEQRGWDLHEYEWWYGDPWCGGPDDAGEVPRNSRELAGWLAREVVFPFEEGTRP
jgi:hypothetical protein